MPHLTEIVLVALMVMLVFGVGKLPNIGLALVSRDLTPGEEVHVSLPDGAHCAAETGKLPFV